MVKVGLLVQLQAGRERGRRSEVPRGRADSGESGGGHVGLVRSVDRPVYVCDIRRVCRRRGTQGPSRGSDCCSAHGERVRIAFSTAENQASGCPSRQGLRLIGSVESQRASMLNVKACWCLIVDDVLDVRQ
jgi:hypothetical protein